MKKISLGRAITKWGEKEPKKSKVNYHYCDNWKNNNYMKSNTEMKPLTNLKPIQKYLVNRLRATTFCIAKLDE